MNIHECGKIRLIKSPQTCECKKSLKNDKYENCEKS